MEIEELKQRIIKTIYLVNNAPSISKKRRYYVFLCDLIEIMNGITGDDIRVGKYAKGPIMKHPEVYYLIRELRSNYKNMLHLSDSIVQTYKDAKWDNHDLTAEFKNYSLKYIQEIVDDFFASIDSKYYQIFRKTKEEKRIFRTQEHSSAHIVYDHADLKSYVFVPKNNYSILFAEDVVHEIGHVIQHDFTKYTMKTSSVNRYDITKEMFSMFIGIIFTDYLRKINFNAEETTKLEKKWYMDFLIFTTQLKFISSFPQACIDGECNLRILPEDELDALAYTIKLEKEDNLMYHLYKTNAIEAAYYTYGGVLADIFRHYFRENPSFIHEIEKHFFDYEAYTTEEILDRLPHVRESLQDMSILRKHLETNIRKSQSID